MRNRPKMLTTGPGPHWDCPAPGSQWHACSKHVPLGAPVDTMAKSPRNLSSPATCRQQRPMTQREGARSDLCCRL